ncbi:MAG: 50S ribosomal protein L23 [Chloroflexi bacterium]|nr:50S ribosomal protein L23 [Chloroflexota bacterium]
MGLHLYDVIVRPVVTEKSNILTDANAQYVFEVAQDANKQQIREAVETIFDKHVKKVNTMIMPAKRGFRGRRTYMRSKQWKKAVVTLEAGERIELFEV